MKKRGYIIRKANERDVKRIVEFIDSTLTKEGYGFITSAQITTEVKRGVVWIAETCCEDTLYEGHVRLIGVRIGANRVYNLVVEPSWRRQGIGKALIEVLPPETIRVKATPVGHLSKEQRENFTTPVGFYRKIGYSFAFFDHARNFWQRGKGKESHFHRQGKDKHIQVWKRESKQD